MLKKFLLLALGSLTILTASYKLTPKASKKCIRIAYGNPETLDPRLARRQLSKTPLHMVYEGLMRHDKEGKLVPGVAQLVESDEAHKVYTFFLRDCYWSNGDKVTAFDFENAWKSLLSPTFPSPYSYQLHVIRGAEEFENGGSWSDVGVSAIDDKTLQVELKAATPYFLELVASHFFFPIHPSQIEKLTPKNLISNGPFSLVHWRQNHELSFQKNPFYWDADEVYLDSVQLLQLDEFTACQLYKKGQIDWMGGPCSYLSPEYLEDLIGVESAPAAGTQLIRINTAEYPFNDPQFRQALSNSINREALIEHVLRDSSTPATHLLPPSWRDGSLAATDSQKIVDGFPPIVLSYSSSPRLHRIAQAIQQQWKETLGLEVYLDTCESVILFEKLGMRRYQLALGAWFGDYHDPINFLDVFKQKTNLPNCTEWESSDYIRLLDEASVTADRVRRQKLLENAEQILLKEQPIIPLFHLSYGFVKKEGICDYHLNELGYIDLKNTKLGDSP